jgi:RNA polymerase sigma-70 factor (ECF subfamily)
LLLRDVVELSARETAEALGLRASAVESALFRARAALAERRPSDVALSPTDVRAHEAALARYVQAFERRDVDALVSILRGDVVTTMPPSPTWIAGRAAHRVFYGEMFARVAPGAFQLARLDCNGGPAFALYRAGALRAIEVLTLARHEVARIDHFMSPEVLALFAPLV